MGSRKNRDKTKAIRINTNRIKELVIDRFESDFAVCETDDLKFVNVNKKDILSDAKEGDTLVLNNDGKYEVDVEKTENKRKEIEELTKDLWI